MAAGRQETADIVVIGAGMAGLACAAAAHAQGLTVTMLDKGRGPGGRMSTRRLDTPSGPVAVDHGAQYFTARDPAFQRAVSGWIARGVAAPWEARFVTFDGAEAVPMSPELRYAGAPGMNAIVRHMAEGLSVRWGMQVAQIEGEAGRWTVRAAEGDVGVKAAAIVVATPAEQAVALLDKVSPALAAEADRVRSEPCWAAMAVFAEPLPCGFDGARLGDGALSWIARNSSKPGRSGPEAWVLHAGPAWSRANLGLTPEDAARRMMAAFRRRTPKAPAPIALTAHRWRYALVEEPIGAAFGWDAARQIGVCGDWRLGGRVESAWLSGEAMGRALGGALAARAA